MSDYQIIMLCISIIGVLIGLITYLIVFLVKNENRIATIETRLSNIVDSNTKSDNNANEIIKKLADTLEAVKDNQVELKINQKVMNNTLEMTNNTMKKVEAFVEGMAAKYEAHEASISKINVSIEGIKETAKKYVTN